LAEPLDDLPSSTQRHNVLSRCVRADKLPKLRGVLLVEPADSVWIGGDIADGLFVNADPALAAFYRYFFEQFNDLNEPTCSLPIEPQQGDEARAEWVFTDVLDLDLADLAGVASQLNLQLSATARVMVTLCSFHSSSLDGSPGSIQSTGSSKTFVT
jgi:hypothetical protein